MIKVSLLPNNMILASVKTLSIAHRTAHRLLGGEGDESVQMIGH
jgi:hypothetical protein